MTTRRDFLKTMTMASAGLAFGAGDVREPVLPLRKGK